MVMENVIAVGVADIKIGQDPSVLTTNLGSCIGVCLYNSDKKIGGMLHFMMARADAVAQKNPDFKKAKYGDSGILEMVHQLKRFHGVDVSSLKAKIFGGAKILQNVSLDIGHANELIAREILKELNIRIIGEKTRGQKGYRIAFDLATGKVKCRIFGEQEEEF